MKLIYPILVMGCLCAIWGFKASNMEPVEVISSTEPTEDRRIEDAWVDSVFQNLSLDQRIGQLFMIRAHSDLGAEHIASVKSQIKKYHVGGLCFFQGTPLQQAKLTNEYQALSKSLPLLVAVDAEWGIGMRFKKDAMSFPRSMTLGSIQDNSLIYKMGTEIARQMRRIGIHVNFAPVVDINNNPNNPVINTRSFGEDRHSVAVKSYMYMLGLQDADVMACAKHFPGHGDTDMDSHYDLPVINYSRERLDSLELFPFRLLAEHGLQSVMTAHLQIPAIEPDGRTPSSLSKAAIQDILKNELNFDGLIFTDGLEMAGIQKNFPLGELEVKALQAGNDILLLPQKIDVAFKAIKKAIYEGQLSEDQIKEKVKKIIRAKYRLRLHEETPIDLVDIHNDLHTPKAETLRAELYERSFTLLNNQDRLIPFINLSDKKYASLAIGSNKITTFQKRLEDYVSINHFKSSKKISPHEHTSLIDGLSKYDRILISFHDLSMHASKNFGLDTSAIQLIKALQKKHEVSVTWFGNPYALKYFQDIDHILLAHEENKIVEDLSAQAMFGAFHIDGKLPVTASPYFRFNDGDKISSLRRVGFESPERVGLSIDSLQLIDELVQKMIKTKAAPGCQILVAKDRKIVYEKSFGHHTYDKKRKVKNTDLYDIASITKVAAATLAVMKLVDDGLIDINLPIKKYLPQLSKTNKSNLTLYDIMAHHAALKSWIPFYTKTLNDNKKNPQPLDSVYTEKIEDDYSIQIANQMYMRNDYIDTLWNAIYDSNLRTKNNYRYSDLGFYLIAAITEKISGMTLDKYVNRHYYHPLGLKFTTYNPLKIFPKRDIVPSENDTYWRKQKIQGHVHDMGSAMIGGVSGHAGLFSNAKELAIIFQMLLNNGYYGGHQYLRPETIALFTHRHLRSTRRGIGFDMRQLDTLLTLNISEYASDQAYGHLGFTGTCVWADPESQLIFIFLSNRTYPSMKNNKLGRENYRPDIQSVVYRAMEMNYELAQ